MYLTVMMSALAVQRDLANAYAASKRASDLGVYLLVQNRATVSYFERVEPPEGMEALHDAFLSWQRSGLEVLAQELRARDPHKAAASQRYTQTSRTFAEAFQALPRSSTSAQA